MVSGGNCSSKRFFTVAGAGGCCFSSSYSDGHPSWKASWKVCLLSMKGARLSKKMKSSNLQQNKTKTGRNRISLKPPQRFISTQKFLPKGTSWSKTMLLWDSQPHRRMVLAKTKMEANAKWKRTGE